MVITDAPGFDEDKAGRPMVGTSGQEARHHLDINGITTKGVWLDSVIRCHPEGNRDPHIDEIANCTVTHLLPTIERIQPQYVITMGRVSTQLLLGNVNMEMVHGIPRPADLFGHPVILIPTYHPAAGLHSPEQMILFQADMKVAGEVIRGKVAPYPPVDEWEGEESYSVVGNNFDWDYVIGRDLITIDTESYGIKGAPWCLSFSVVPGEAWVVMADQTQALARLNEAVNYPDTITGIHNALYDLPVLAQMGATPARPADTMVMAYLLQSEPQGLKPLAFRHCGMEMGTYSSMVGEATRAKAIDYLETVMAMEWPDPDPVLEWKKGEPHVRQPQNIKRKVRKVLSDISAGKDVDPYDRWKKMGDTEQVEAVIGEMEEGYLSDIPFDDAIYYSARDADATIRIWPILMSRIQALGLEDTFWRDMRAMPMVVDMMANGMPVDLDAFAELSTYFQDQMDKIQTKIQVSVGKHLPGLKLNPGSSQQMSTLIYDKLKLHEAGGKFKSKKGASTKSTADDILKRYLPLHPVIQDIIDWRGYQKLKSSYADTIPKKTSPDGRIRTTLRMTRVATGRLSSSNPNLMAQPIRSSEGRKIRDCYVAPGGWSLVSGDYSQVEMRVAADGAKDERMLDIFTRGIDIHSVTASEMFKVPVPQLDEMRHRYPAKRVGFGILNLITAQGLQRELEVGGAAGWTVHDCEDMIHEWFRIYSGIAKYMKANGEYARRYGYVRDCWGRIRFIPGIRSQNKWVRIEAERQAGNAPIQMGAQGVIKEAMGRLVPVVKKWEDEISPLIQIHDDIVWLARTELLSVILPEVKRIMEEATPPGFKVPLNVDFKAGVKWGSLSKIVI